MDWTYSSCTSRWRAPTERTLTEFRYDDSGLRVWIRHRVDGDVNGTWDSTQTKDYLFDPANPTGHEQVQVETARDGGPAFPGQPLARRAGGYRAAITEYSPNRHGVARRSVRRHHPRWVPSPRHERHWIVVDGPVGRLPGDRIERMNGSGRRECLVRWSTAIPDYRKTWATTAFPRISMHVSACGCVRSNYLLSSRRDFWFGTCVERGSAKRGA
jgi:hypothetical protein